MIAGTTQLSQKHYAEEVLRTYGYWDTPPRLTPMKLNTRLSKDDCDMSPKPDFHKHYRSVVGSLGYLVTMTCPDLVWSYSELSKYVQSQVKRTRMRLIMSYIIYEIRGMKLSSTHAALAERTNCRDG